MGAAVAGRAAMVGLSMRVSAPCMRRAAQRCCCHWVVLRHRALQILSLNQARHRPQSCLLHSSYAIYGKGDPAYLNLLLLVPRRRCRNCPHAHAEAPVCIPSVLPGPSNPSPTVTSIVTQRTAISFLPLLRPCIIREAASLHREGTWHAWRTSAPYCTPSTANPA